jgi:hypothetical protein
MAFSGYITAFAEAGWPNDALYYHEDNFVAVYSVRISGAKKLS